MNHKLAGMLLWAGWFLASAVICSLLRTSAMLLSARVLTPTMAQDFATAAIGIILPWRTHRLTPSQREGVVAL